MPMMTMALGRYRKLFSILFVTRQWNHQVLNELSGRVCISPTSSTTPTTLWHSPSRANSHNLSPIQGNAEEEEDENGDEILIRNSLYADMGSVADLIMQSFYGNTTKSPFKQLYRLGELNRIQQGFPYSDTQHLHRMFVAVAQPKKETKLSSGGRNKDEQTIVGFCDIDLRTPNRPTSYSYNPRPYLSDLCIHPDYRRRGIAQSLVQASEDFIVGTTTTKTQQGHIRNNTLYIRVEKNNTAALNMYNKLGYLRHKNPDDPLGKTVILLQKNLTLALSPSPSSPVERTMEYEI